MVLKNTNDRRKNLIIGREFQFKISLYFILVAALCSFCILFVLLTVQENNVELFYTVLGDDAETFSRVFLKHKIILYLVTFLFFLVLSCALFLLGLHYSHRIIGPVSRITSHLREAVKNEFYISPLYIRKKDYMHHIKRTYNHLLFSVNNRNKFYIDHAKNIIPDLEIAEKTIKKSDPSFSIEKEINFLKGEIEKEKLMADNQNKENSSQAN